MPGAISEFMPPAYSSLESTVTIRKDADSGGGREEGGLALHQRSRRCKGRRNQRLEESMRDMAANSAESQEAICEQNGREANEKVTVH